MIQPIFEDMLREQGTDLFSGGVDEIIHHTPSPKLSEELTLRFPSVVAVVPPEVQNAPIRWTPTLPP